MLNKKYEKPARPFEIWNIGNYETVYWQEREDEYLVFMLKLCKIIRSKFLSSGLQALRDADNREI